MVANRLTAPRPLYDIQRWAEAWAVEEALGVRPADLNDDRLGRCLDEYRGHAERLSDGAQAASPEVEAAWTALALATRAGDPSDFSQAMTATTGAVEALADDVLAHLRSYD